MANQKFLEQLECVLVWRWPAALSTRWWSRGERRERMNTGWIPSFLIHMVSSIACIIHPPLSRFPNEELNPLLYPYFLKICYKVRFASFLCEKLRKNELFWHIVRRTHPYGWTFYIRSWGSCKHFQSKNLEKFHKAKMILDLFVRSLKEGRNCGSDPFLRKNSINSLLARCVLEPIVKVGWKFWDLLCSPLKLWENFRI